MTSAQSAQSASVAVFSRRDCFERYRDALTSYLVARDELARALQEQREIEFAAPSRQQRREAADLVSDMNRQCRCARREFLSARAAYDMWGEV
jgi:hypothetical protein